MKKIKSYLFILIWFAFAHSAHAVVEPVKVLQYSLRNVQATIEVIQHILELTTSIQHTSLQGTIGSVSPTLVDMGGKVAGRDFAPVLSSELRGVVSGNGLNAVPQLRSYVNEELKSIKLGDGISQRDVLHKLNEMDNLMGVSAIKLGKEALAKTNKAVQENAQQLSIAGNAADLQEKISQETGVSLRTLQNDTFRNQLSSNLLQTKAMRYKSAVLKATQEGEKLPNTLIDEAKGSLDGVDGNVSSSVNNQLNQLTKPISDTVQKVQGEINSVQNDLGNATNRIQQSFK